MIEATNAPAARFMIVDEEGYFSADGLRIADAEAGRAWMASVQVDEGGCAWTAIGLEKVILEPFDEPYVALDLSPRGEREDSTVWQITVPYGHKELVHLETLRLDEWDRFHGKTDRGVPFVLSRSAQARFFELLEEYSDTSITIGGREIPTSAYLTDNHAVDGEDFWSDLYRKADTRWDLGEPARVLPALAPRLKLTRSRVLVAGAGAGNDAAWFAEQGHIVTAIDFSAEAVERARTRYGHLPDLKFVQADVFNLSPQMNGAFDIVFEHTLFCAVSPSRRADLIKVWRRLLIENGHLMAVFAVMNRQSGPPFGASEWELRARLQKNFRSLYWTRLRDSFPHRMGRELFVYAQKLSAL